MKKYLISVLIIITSVIFIACGTAANTSMRESYDMAYMAPATEMYMGAVEMDYINDAIYNEISVDGGGITRAVTLPAQIEPEAPARSDLAFRKLIKDANLSVETEEFDFLLKDIEFRVNALGGYMEHFSASNNSRYGFNVNNNRFASMTIRIPAVEYDTFINMVGDISNVLHRNESIRDVTLQYVDLESRKEALQVEFDRLLELLARAESIEDIILLEQRLSDVRYNIEWLGSQLRTFDNLVSYSTIYLYIDEVKELTPVVELSFGEKISAGFTASLKSIGNGITNFVIWLMVSSPFLVIWAAFITVGVFVVRLIIKKAKLKRQKEE